MAARSKMIPAMGAVVPLAVAAGAGTAVAHSGLDHIAHATSHCRKYAPSTGAVDSGCASPNFFPGYASYHTDGIAYRTNNIIGLNTEAAYMSLWFSAAYSGDVSHQYGWSASTGGGPAGQQVAYCGEDGSYESGFCFTEYH